MNRLDFLISDFNECDCCSYDIEIGNSLICW